MLPEFRKKTLFYWKVPRLSPFVRLIKAAMKMKMSMDHCGIKLRKENRINRKNTCPSVTLSTIDLTWTILG
jgi:hypothetical protein